MLVRSLAFDILPSTDQIFPSKDAAGDRLCPPFVLHAHADAVWGVVEGYLPMLEAEWPVWARGQILAARQRAATAAAMEEDEESDPFGAALDDIVGDHATPPPNTPSHSTRSVRSRASLPSVVIETRGPRAPRKHARSPSTEMDQDDPNESEPEAEDPAEESDAASGAGSSDDDPTSMAAAERDTSASSTRALRPRATRPAPPLKKKAKMMVPRAAQASEPALGKHWRVSLCSRPVLRLSLRSS